jgi:Tfp pilus assembly protein PilZ
MEHLMDKLVLVSSKQNRDMRVPFKNVVKFGVDRSNLHLDKAHDISKSGMFIETEKKLKVGSKVHLNFDLITDFQVKNIKAVGKVVRSADTIEKAGKSEGSGVGIKFSLLPSEEFLIRGFVKDIANQTTESSPSSNQPAKHICVEVKNPPGSLFCLFKWWLKDIVAKAFAFNGLIMQLVILVIFIAISIMVFL